jgi:VCBS repeat-containing protein
VSGNVLANDTDPDGLPASLEVANPGTYVGSFGSLDLAADGTYTYSVNEAAAEAALLGPVDDMVAHWTFDSSSGGTVPDEAPTGSPNNVDLQGNNLTSDGQIGGAVVLDGSNRLTMSNSSEINLGTHQQRTVSLHFNADDLSGRQVLYEEGGQVRGLNVFIENGNLFVGGWNTPNGESNWDGDWIDLGPIDAGEWNHVALVLDGGATVTDGALTAYLNGSPAGSAPGSQLWQHSGDVSIGGSGGNSRYPDGTSSAANNFSGLIDDVRIYNAAVTPSDLAELAAQDGTLTDTFSYSATDGAALSNGATLAIVVDSVPPTAPTTQDAATVVAEDTAVVFEVSDFPFADPNAGDTLQAVRISGLPVDGDLEFFDGSSWTAVTAGQVIIAADIEAGHLRFTPAVHASGSDAFGGTGVGDQQADYAQFTFEVSDGGLFGNVATLAIDVTPVADLPDLVATLAGNPTATPQTLLAEDFNDGNADGWTAVDLGPNPILSVSQGVGNWVVENGVLEQNDPAGAEHTFMQYDSTPAIRALESYTLSVDIDPNRSGSDLGVTNNAVGLVFGYSDPDNYYRVEWVNFSSSYAPGGSNANTYGGGELHKDFRLVRVENGSETILAKTDVAAISNGEVFTLTLNVDATGGIVAQAGGYTLNHSDTPSLDDFGLYSWDNDNDIGYDNVVLTAQDYRYDLSIASNLVDLDGSEALTIQVSNLPPDTTLSAGSQNLDGSWSVDASDLPGLQLVTSQPLADPALTVTATATETVTGDQASQIVAVGGDGILVGGPGDDLFVTGAGDDELIWNATDAGTAGLPAVDRVSGFDHNADALNIQNLLVDETQGDLTDYLHFEQDGADGVVHVSTTGGFSAGYVAAAEDQTIVLENVDISAFGASDQQIIDALLASNSLITD